MVKHITVAGKNRPFIICMEGWFTFLKGKGADGDELTTEKMLQYTDELAYIGFLYGKKKVERTDDADFNREDVALWISSDLDLWSDVVDMWIAALPKLLENQKKMTIMWIGNVNEEVVEQQTTENRAARRAKARKS